MNKSVETKGAELGMNERASYLLGCAVDAADTAVKDAMKRLVELQTVLDGDDDDAKLSALRYLASHAGYSNSAVTACAELMTAAGKVAGLLESI